MAVTAADVKALGAELATVDDSVVNVWIEDAELELNETTLAGRYDLAVKYLAAHKTKLAMPGGSSGTVQSVAVGGVSRSYSAGSVSAGAYDRTTYGQEFTRIVEGTAACRLTVSA